MKLRSLLVAILLCVGPTVSSALLCNEFFYVEKLSGIGGSSNPDQNEPNQVVECAADEAACFTFTGVPIEGSGIDTSKGGCLPAATSCDDVFNAQGDFPEFSCQTCTTDECNEIITLGNDGDGSDATRLSLGVSIMAVAIAKAIVLLV